MKIPVKKINNVEKPIILIAAVLDESGSMASQQQQVIQGFNEYIQDHQKKDDANYLITLVKFSDKVTTVFSGKDVRDVYPITSEDYRPGGSTALRDAIGTTIHQIDARRSLCAVNPKVLIFIFTDGWENASREFSVNAIKRMISERESQKDWTFTFIGASPDCIKQAAEYGIPVGNTIWYNANNFQGTISALSYATSTYSANVNSGVSRSSTFFKDANINSASDLDNIGTQVSQNRQGFMTPVDDTV